MVGIPTRAAVQMVRVGAYNYSTPENIIDSVCAGVAVQAMLTNIVSPASLYNSEPRYLLCFNKIINSQ